jgi:3-deoxy-D-manno-octulosonic-acid transferase
MSNSHFNQSNSSIQPKPTVFKPSWRFQLFMVIYRILWCAALPMALLYLLKKSRKEPQYRQHLKERFGIALPSFAVSKTRPIWLHAASMGELKGITPLISVLLAQGRLIVLTTLTPAGKYTAQQYFSDEIAQQTLCLSYVPLELASSVRRFVNHYQPLCALMAEIDSWPVLLTTLKRNKVPLGFVNAQYPKKSFERDIAWGGVRRELFQIYDLIACKSHTHATRFRACGNPNIHIAGETRFDLRIPDSQLQQGDALAQAIGARPIFTFASIVAGEEAIFIHACLRVKQYCIEHSLPQPFWIFVPRSPQRFEIFHQTLQTNKLHFIRRSMVLDAQLHLRTKNESDSDLDIDQCDGLLGDSLGEMYFYLKPAQVVVVGASFVALGSHNIIEPLALKKNVIVGDSVWGIEYPGVEALAAKVLQSCSDEDALVACLLSYCIPNTCAIDNTACDTFYDEHAGSTQKHLAILNHWLALTPLIP